MELLKNVLEEVTGEAGKKHLSGALGGITTAHEVVYKEKLKYTPEPSTWTRLKGI